MNTTPVNKSNMYRKIRGLLARVTAEGCPPAEAAADLQSARQIVRQYELGEDTAAAEWPEPPAGYEWLGDEVVKIDAPDEAAAPKVKKARKAKAPRACLPGFCKRCDLQDQPPPSVSYRGNERCRRATKGGVTLTRPDSRQR